MVAVVVVFVAVVPVVVVVVVAGLSWSPARADMAKVVLPLALHDGLYDWNLDLPLDQADKVHAYASYGPDQAGAGTNGGDAGDDSDGDDGDNGDEDDAGSTVHDPEMADVTDRLRTLGR